MVEASLNTPMKISNSKKRKNEQSQFSKAKKSMLMTPQNLEGGEVDHPCTDISASCSAIGNKPYRKNYHLGGKKYAIFHGERDVIDHIQIKEWDGKVVIKEGVK